jgi:oligopeptide transport system substrate-binding protein
MKNSVVLVSLILSLLSSCEKSTIRKKELKTFRLSFPYDISTLDPRKNSDYINSTAHFMLYEGLTRMNQNSTHEKGICERIEISENKKTYTFFLKKTFWSDGKPLTAKDFIFAWKSLLDPKFPAPNAHLFFPIKNSEKIKKGILPVDSLGVREIGELTLEVELENPTPYFLELTSFCPFFPVPSHLAENDPNWADHRGDFLVTNGPFKLKKKRFSESYDLVKNPLYWERNEVKLDKIEIQILSDELTSLRLYEKDQLDFYGAYSPIPAEWILKYKEIESLTKKPFGATTFISFNLKDTIFKNKNVRKAFSIAINRKLICENITLADEIPAYEPIPPILKKNISRSFFKDNDAIEANKLLDLGLKELNLGRKDLEEIKLSFATNILQKTLAQAIQDRLNETLGVTISLDEAEFKIHRTKLQKKDYQIGFSSFYAQYFDPMNILDRFKECNNHFNYPGFENKEYENLLTSSNYAKTAEERAEMLAKAEEILNEEIPFTPLYHLNLVYLTKPNVKGLYISPIGSIHLNHVNIEDTIE